MNDSVIPFALLCFTSFFTLINPLANDARPSFHDNRYDRK